MTEHDPWEGLEYPECIETRHCPSDVHCEGSPKPPGLSHLTRNAYAPGDTYYSTFSPSSTPRSASVPHNKTEQCSSDEDDKWEREWEERREREGESEWQREQGSPLPSDDRIYNQLVAIQVTERDPLLGRFSRLLKNHGRRKALLGLRGDDAQVMIDYIHSVLSQPHLSSWLRKHSRIVLYRLCSASTLYPQRYVLKDVVKEDSPEASGQSKKLGNMTAKAC
ncbi:hypothetical protein P691DRAFT_760291 [Macrolepiota fuliginosa MF-IS2]|uniref:Uncharacterized protein n=1 Tax=Macrolepiota fuliginosa MF-IS2 TaxID=1400762 RepID=A0A9P5XBJ0_9AGAR|nr:hypothetical protein P691DRAFT_760291 [Macrolepiota fuliginosa MF-IS2]